MNPTFYLCTYHDEFLLSLCLKNIRKHYSSRVIVVSDGDTNPKISKICRKHSVEFHMSEWLYGVEHCGRRHHRMLELFFENPSSHLIKIDTDTKVLRRLESLPTHFCNFGTSEFFGGEEILQGGCLGYPQEVAEKLYQDKVFLDDSVRVENWCINDWCVVNKGRISEDQINSYCIKKIGCPFYQHPEIMSLGPRNPLGTGGDFAVIHPFPRRKPTVIFDKYLVQVL